MLERRLTWLAAIVLAWGAAISCRLIYLQILKHGEYARTARSRQEMPIEIQAPRGAIFDRNGQPLAMSVAAYSIHVNPRLIDIPYASDILSRVLHLDRDEMRARMNADLARNKGFMWVKRRISQDEWAAISDLMRGTLDLGWIGVEKESQRQYPNGSLAAHVLGSVDFEEKGNGGIERALDADLRGVPGRVRMLTDVKRRPIEGQVETDPQPGKALVLSIDSRIQYVAEREIAAAVEKQNAKTGSVVVLNPYTGDVLALASYPSFDPNQRPSPKDPPRSRMNNAVEAPFEPGSVFKVITLTAALETTRLTPESIIDCGHGSITLFGRTIREAHGGYGAVPLRTVLIKSSNVGAIRIGMQVGQDHMFEYVKKFGFGKRTGIGLPAESVGMVRPLRVWGSTSLASVSMGQEIGTTTIQLAQAASVIANGGLLVKPRLVLKSDGQAVAPPQPARVVRAETAITMRQIMEEVVLEGTGKRAQIAGYTSGGKTGSAQIFDYQTKHYTHTYNASFMGFAPVANPAIVVVVTINGTTGSSGFGGAAAAPVFQVVASEALRVLDVPKDLPEELPKTLIAKKTIDEDAPPLDSAVNRPELREEEEPPAPDNWSGPRVPNFRGMTKRAVLTEANAKGLKVLPDGSGVARIQDPPPGSPLYSGSRIRVVFER
jgi:cell division protein FtsI (penicillin-binding protein 3)